MRSSSSGDTVPRQNSSTYASVLMPSIAGSTWMVKPRMTPSATSRSTRRLTADADSPTTEPMSP